MVKKTDLVRQAVASKEWKKALKIAKDFRLGITKEQKDAMTRAYECMVHPRFYEQLGYDLDNTVKHGCNIVTTLFG